MKKLNKNLSEIFDVEPIEEGRIETMPVVIDDSANQIDADAEFARTNMSLYALEGIVNGFVEHDDYWEILIKDNV